MSNKIIVNDTSGFPVEYDLADFGKSGYASIRLTKSALYRTLEWLRPIIQATKLKPIDECLRSDAHVTLIYSKERGLDLRYYPNPQNLNRYYPIAGNAVPATVTEFEFWAGHGEAKGYLVAKLASSGLDSLHEQWKSRGLKHSYPEYQSHMTMLTPCVEDTALVNTLNARLKDFPLTLDFTDERIEPVT